MRASRPVAWFYSKLTLIGTASSRRASAVVRDQSLERGVGIRAVLLEPSLDEKRPAAGAQGTVRYPHHAPNPLTV